MVQTAILAAYSVVLAIFLATYLISWLPQQPYEGSREINVRLSIEALALGAPPLTGIASSPERAEEAYPLFTQDDEGIYLYLPAIAHVLGIREPKVAQIIFTFGMLVPVILIYPLLIYALFDSLLAGLIAPLALLLRFGLFLDHDIYWIPAWTLLVCLPFVYAAHRHWSRSVISALAIVLVIASIASTIRGHAGLPILVSAVGLALAKERSWGVRSGLAILFLVIYFGVGPGMLSGARHYRDLRYGHDWASSTPTAHPFWHPVYLRLSYLPNPYGITWNDSVAAKAVHDEDPSIGYVTPAYEDTLRRLYLRILEVNPGFVVATYLSKALALWDDLISANLPLLFLAVLGMVFPPRRGQMRALMLLTAPALALSAVPPLLAIPDVSFERAWFAAGAMVWILGLGWAVALVTSLIASVRSVPALRGLPRVHFGSGSVRRRLPSLLVSVLAAGLMVAAVGATDADRARLQAIRAYSQASALAPSDLSGVPVASWIFRSGLPDGWWLNPRASIRAISEGTLLVTAPEKFNYQLISPDLTVVSGAYQLVLRGKPRSGGITVGVLDVKRDVWVTTSNYFAGQGGFDNSAMVANFQTTESLTIMIIFANWNIDGASSEWELRQAELRSTTPSR